MNGQPILPIQVLLPAPASTKSSGGLFEKTHDFVMNFIPDSFKMNLDYLAAAQFDKSDHVSTTTLLCVRAFFAYYLLTNMLLTYWLNTDGIMHMWYYFTYWGIAATMFAMVYANKTVQNKKKYQPTAILFAELAFGFNAVIFPFFWIVLAPHFIKTRKWDNFLDIVSDVHLILSHCLPLIASLTNIWLTKDHVLLSYDHKYVFALGVVYIYFNYIGTIAEGHYMYPIADWSNFYETVFLYLVLAALEAGAMYFFAIWICKKRNFVPTHS